MIKAVIFDYGGVLKVGRRLSDDLPEIFNVSKEVIKDQANNAAPLFSLLQKNLISENEFWEKYSALIKKPVPHNCGQMARELYQKYFVAYPKMKVFINKLRNANIKTAVLSNIIGLCAEVIKKNGGYDGFDTVVLSCEEKLEKPSPEIYNLTIKKLGVRPDECIFIDDKKENLLTAEGLGIKVISADNPEQVIKDVSNIINLENETII